MRDVIYYADVPAYSSIKLELQSSSKLIMEGRLQGDSSSNKGSCPGASMQFCGNVSEQRHGELGLVHWQQRGPRACTS